MDAAALPTITDPKPWLDGGVLGVLLAVLVIVLPVLLMIVIRAFTKNQTHVEAIATGFLGEIKSEREARVGDAKEVTALIRDKHEATLARLEKLSDQVADESRDIRHLRRDDQQTIANLKSVTDPRKP